MEHHHISAERLTVARLGEILERRLPVALSDDARARIVRCREYLDRKMEHPERPIYGITTGFGSLCDISVGRDELAQLQRNLVMSHACGTGERVPSEIVRLIRTLKGLTFPVTDYAPFEYAVTTAGGVRCDEVNPETMESRRVRGLYFAGEVLDLDANTGGYNLQIAFSTGRLAGMLKK